MAEIGSDDAERRRASGEPERSNLRNRDLHAPSCRNASLNLKMNDANLTLEEEPFASCSYCGRENPERLPACPGCGTSLVRTEAVPKRKSKALAVLLALVFGPAGLFYVRAAWWCAVVVIVIGVVIRLLGMGGLWLSVVARIFCMIWIYRHLSELEEPIGGKQDPVSLLNRAAALESYDRAEAIAAYEEIIRLYPDTPASKESQQNIATLRKNL